MDDDLGLTNASDGITLLYVDNFFRVHQQRQRPQHQQHHYHQQQRRQRI